MRFFEKKIIKRETNEENTVKLVEQVIDKLKTEVSELAGAY